MGGYFHHLLLFLHKILCAGVPRVNSWYVSSRSGDGRPVCKLLYAPFTFTFTEDGSTMLHITPNRRQHSVEINPMPSSDLHNLIGGLDPSKHFFKKLLSDTQAMVLLFILLLTVFV